MNRAFINYILDNAPLGVLLAIPLISLYSGVLATLVCLTLVIISFYRDESLICAAVVASGYHGVFQLDGRQLLGASFDVLLSGLLTLRLVYLVCVTKQTKLPSVPLFLFSLFMLYELFNCIFRSFERGGTYTALVAKDFILPLASFFYFIYVFNNRHKFNVDLVRCLKFMFLGIVAVATLSVVNYFADISSEFERFVLPIGLGEEYASRRSVLGLDVIRMNSLFALSTQGAAGCLYGICLASLVFYGKYIFGNSAIRICCLFSMLLACILGVSFTALFTVIIFCFLYYMLNNKSMKLRSSQILLPGVLLFLMISSSVFLTIDVGVGRELSILEYGYDNFLRPSLDRFVSMDAISIIFGIGLMPKLYLSGFLGTVYYLETFKLVYDNWIMGVIFQLGLVGLSIVLFLLVQVFVRIACVINTERWRMLAAISFLSMIGFAHGLFLLDRLFIFKAMFLLALVFSNGKEDSLRLIK